MLLFYLRELKQHHSKSRGTNIRNSICFKNCAKRKCVSSIYNAIIIYKIKWFKEEF